MSLYLLCREKMENTKLTENKNQKGLSKIFGIRLPGRKKSGEESSATGPDIGMGKGANELDVSSVHGRSRENKGQCLTFSFLLPASLN